MATYTKSLSQRNTAHEKELAKKLKRTIAENLQTTFQLAIEEKGFNQATIDLLENRLDIVDEIARTIYNTKKDNGTLLYIDYDYNNIFDDVLKSYINELNTFKKIYNAEQKAKKEYYEEKVFNHVIDEIEQAKEKGANIENIRKAILTSDYKKIVLKEIKKTTRHFDEKIFNSIYNLTINKVMRVYKNDITEQQETKQNKIPLGWRVYGITKAISKITGAKL